MAKLCDRDIPKIAHMSINAAAEQLSETYQDSLTLITEKTLRRWFNNRIYFNMLPV